MKLLGPIALLAAGSVLGAIAWMAPAQESEQIKVAGGDLVVPTTLTAPVPAGHVVRAFAVDNMCKACCPPAVFRAVTVLREVREAAVDMRRARAEVVVPADLDPARIAAILTAHGYPARLLP